MGFDGNTIVPPGARIKVVGVGGGGGNAVNTMIRSALEGVDFVAANTDVQALRLALPETKIQLGKELTKGLGAGADPDVGRDAALEDRHEIQEALAGADMVFITAGMGGGTGTGGASVIAQIAREMGALTVGVVTKPFNFEGKRRRKHAELGMERLRENVDTLITIPNQRLLQIATPDLSMVDAFRMADDVLVNAVKGISDIINIPGTVNVDFADVKAVMSCMGMALMGIGRARGENRAVEAARQAISSPLLEDVDIQGATGILINITAGSTIGLMEVNEACSIIQEAAHEDANIIFGAVIDDEVGDEIRVTVIATGFPVEYSEMSEAVRDPRFEPKRIGGSRGNVLQSYRSVQSIPSPAFRASQTAAPKPVAPQPILQTPAQSLFSQASVTPTFPLKEPANIVETSPTQQEPKVEAKIEIKVEREALPPIVSVAAEEPLVIEEKIFPEFDAEITVTTEDPVSLSQDIDVQESIPFIVESVEIAEDEGAVLLPKEIKAEVEKQFEIDHVVKWEKSSFDKKIDEALELAERLREVKSLSSVDSEEELETPTFLRGGVREISLD